MKDRGVHGRGVVWRRNVGDCIGKIASHPGVDLWLSQTTTAPWTKKLEELHFSQWQLLTCVLLSFIATASFICPPSCSATARLILIYHYYVPSPPRKRIPLAQPLFSTFYRCYHGGEWPGCDGLKIFGTHTRNGFCLVFFFWSSTLSLSRWSHFPPKPHFLLLTSSGRFFVPSLRSNATSG